MSRAALNYLKNYYLDNQEGRKFYLQVRKEKDKENAEFEILDGDNLVIHLTCDINFLDELKRDTSNWKYERVGESEILKFTGQV